jgi:hypothetical protein
MVLGITGKLYVASNNQLKVYQNWDDLVKDISITIKKFDAPISAITVDLWKNILLPEQLKDLYG